MLCSQSGIRSATQPLPTRGHRSRHVPDVPLLSTFAVVQDESTIPKRTVAPPVPLQLQHTMWSSDGAISRLCDTSAARPQTSSACQPGESAPGAATCGVPAIPPTSSEKTRSHSKEILDALLSLLAPQQRPSAGSLCANPTKQLVATGPWPLPLKRRHSRAGKHHIDLEERGEVRMSQAKPRKVHLLTCPSPPVGPASSASPPASASACLSSTKRSSAPVSSTASAKLFARMRSLWHCVHDSSATRGF